MDFTNLGRTGLSVSRLCLGTMNFGPRTSEEDSHAIMDAAHEAGINFFDTANRYGTEPGETETILGNWFASGGGRRERTVLATKVYGAMGDWPNEGKLSALNIRRALDASLRRLQTDYVDLYQFHHIDRDTPWEEIWQAIEVAVQAGKILYAGSSNFAGWHIADAQAAARQRNLMGLVSEQSLYNLLVRDIELEVVPAAEHYGLGIIPWSPLQGGLLGGVIKKENTGVRRLEGRAAESLAQHRDAIQAYEDLAEEIGAEPGTLALAWLLTRPAVAAPIIGPRTDDQLDTALSAVELEVSAETLRRLDEIFPGRKTAPEDYAW
jgi:NDP-hexose C3-ketoreductase / dTDP-4-oxo-2-deoxy-alpha-D-pentos-2-ene 2,3-reductase